ncbi:hypothetical protein [Ferruginibacter sp.]|nr:hypothetical protein [Ferruginibacter sp.]
MNELTYILGAGASYYSFPLVKTFSDRFNYFLKITKYRTSVHNKSFLSALENFSNEIKVHQSFDTYFKKLFHLGNEYDILEAKKILNFYFLWEQLEFPKNSPHYSAVTDSQGNDMQYPEHANSFKKEALIDSRYDALIAGLLKPIKGKSEFFTKVNFISWNYDLNLLSSIKNFLSPVERLNEFLLKKITKENGNIWEFENDLRIINMNGFFFSKFFDNLKKFDLENVFKIKDKLYERKDTFSFDKDIDVDDAKKINFGWEDLNTKIDLIENASNAIRNSKSVIVIGYTFPSYNRYIDAKYFTPSTLAGKDIFVQDPRADEIVDFLQSEFDMDEPYKAKLINERLRPKFYTKKNCDSFFIPNNIISKI